MFSSTDSSKHDSPKIVASLEESRSSPPNTESLSSNQSPILSQSPVTANLSLNYGSPSGSSSRPGTPVLSVNDVQDGPFLKKR